jgi:hypothetical protein
MDRDPVTGAPVPADAIQRVLYLAPQVHVFRLPPGPPSSRGHMAASWTAQPGGGRIFTARLRLVETAVPSKPKPGEGAAAGEKVTATILLEDPATGELFAAAPYASRAAVEQAADSARFFAVRVVGPGGAKASLGVGFEQRPDAFDFGVALQDVRRVLGLEPPAGGPAAAAKSAVGGGEEQGERTDWSLKEGETITISMGGRGRRRPAKAPAGDGSAAPTAFLPPPPSAADLRAEMKTRRSDPEPQQDDDDDFGDFH